MSPGTWTGAEALRTSLESLGVECVFGLPGTQTVPLYEALRRSSIRTVLATHELGAAFMANGYARASGRVGVVATIPGPGFTYALTGLAEARLDSAPLLHIVPMPADAIGRKFQLQAIDQAAIAAPLVKAVYDVNRADEIAPQLAAAYRLARSGEPGPVLVQLRTTALHESLVAPPPFSEVDEEDERTTPIPMMDESTALLAAARRPVLFVGQGAVDAADALGALAERLGAPIVTTPSGRGVIPEDHPLALGFDIGRGSVDLLNEFLESADLILALGCKLGHNGTGGFALRIPDDRLVHVNTDAEALGANYPARVLIHAPVDRVVDGFLQCARARGDSSADDREGVRPGWRPAEISRWRERLRTPGGGVREPSIHHVPNGNPRSFFALLRRILPRDAILVTDSGLHQMLARRHFDVLAPRGLLLPSDFQSMGFGIPAAIGAALAAPKRPVVALVGDGGFAMAGMELLTAVRERIPVTIVVFNDGKLNLIRLQQLEDFGHAHAVTLRNPDFDAFSVAVGARYFRLAGDVASVLRAAVTSRGPALVEVGVGDSTTIRMAQARSIVRESTRTLLGPRLTKWLKERLWR